MRRILIACWLGLALVATAADAEQRPSATARVPREVQAAQTAVAGWLNGLSDNTQAQIEAQLGKPTESKTWEFQDHQEILLEYEMTHPKRALQLYFYGETVIKASLQFLSD